jgi:hypothetical protein
MQKKLCSDGDDSGTKEFKQGYGGTYGGFWWSLHLEECGIWSHAVSFVMVHVVESKFSCHEDVYTFNLLYKQTINFVLY